MAKTVEEWREKIAEIANLNPDDIRTIRPWDVETEEGYIGTLPSFYRKSNKKRYAIYNDYPWPIGELKWLFGIKNVRII